MPRKHPAYLYTYPPHARRAVLDADLADRARDALAWHPAYRTPVGKAFWAELGRALQEHDAATVAGSCEILADLLSARRIDARSAAALARAWRLGRLG